jgi:hypothetical protein
MVLNTRQERREGQERLEGLEGKTFPPILPIPPFLPFFYPRVRSNSRMKETSASTPSSGNAL